MASILNLARLDRKLKRLPDAVTSEIKAAMEAVAEDIVRLAKSLVPKDSYDLENSIGWTWGAPPQGSLTLGKVAKSKLGKDLTITVYAGDHEAFYARWVEFGTKASAGQASRRSSKWRSIVVMTKGRKAHAATPAQPFFFPAYRANRKNAKAKIHKATRSAAKKVAAGG